MKTILEMKDIEVYETILAYGLSLRQVPLEVVHLNEMRRHKEGNEVVEREHPTLSKAHYDQLKELNPSSKDFIFDDSNKAVFKRRYTRYVTIPKLAGHWMCQQVPGTSSTVHWDAKTHHCAPR